MYRFTDIESPPPGPASSVIPQFEYDEIGNLVGDHINNLSISWNNYGKIDHILNTQNNSSIYFTYDPMGNRVRKINYSDDSNKSDYTATYYVHDAQGNVMAMYNERNIGTNHLYNLSNWTMYGSSRLGIVFPPKDHVLYDTQFGNSWELPIEQMNVGLKRYEISNHLGNVLATITDRPVGVDSITTNESVEYFEPSLASASDYYPFGMLMPSRNIKSQVYPSGFNGKENDNEIKGVGNSLDFGARMYDSRLGRWMSVDPKFKSFSWQSPYCSFDNNPIIFIDPTGGSGVAYITDQKNKDGKLIIKVVSNVYIYGAGATDGNAKTMQGNAMAQYNNNGNYFSATVDGVEYEVQFDIKVQVIDAKDVENKLLPGGYETLNAENNFYEMVDNPKSINNSGVTLSGEDKEGSRGGSTGFIKTSEAGTSTLSHELNHGYGGTNKDLPDGDETKLFENDIAVQDKNSTNPSSRKVTQGNIDAIFKNVDFKGGKTANVGNPRPQLYDNTTGKSKSVSPK